MKFDPVIDFVQTHFGTDNGFPNNYAEVRPPLPNWLAERIGEGLLLESDEKIVIEGEPDIPALPPETLGDSIETFAFYLPFHFYRKKWGIYVRVNGIKEVALHLSKHRKFDIDAITMAFKLLLEHERLHFYIEYAASRREIITDHDCYPEYFLDKVAALHEEAFANAFAIARSRFRQPRVLTMAAIAWMLTQPEGYCDFEKWLKPGLTEAKRIALGYMNLELAMLHRLQGSGLPPAEFLFKVSPQLAVPIYLMIDSPITWLRILKPFPKDFGISVEVHTRDHKPPHIHIKSLLRDIETRYEWPKLRPLIGDPTLSRVEEKRFEKYLNKYRSQIDTKIKSIPWE